MTVGPNNILAWLEKNLPQAEYQDSGYLSIMTDMAQNALLERYTTMNNMTHITPPEQDLDDLEQKAKAATSGPWKVFVTKHPRYDGGQHTENLIGTAWIDGQLKDHFPVMTISTGIGETKDGPPTTMVFLRKQDADHIAAFNPAVALELIAKIRAADAKIEILERICGESYQVMNTLAEDADRLDEDCIIAVLDNLAMQEIVHEDVLPFPSKLVPNGWQTIDTAPAGIEVDVWHEAYGRVADAMLVDGVWKELMYPTMTSEREQMNPQPTHYMIIKDPT